MAKRFHEKGLVTVELDVNGATDISGINKEMIAMFAEVGAAYKSKNNKSVLNIRRSLKAANQIIYREARSRAPIITPDNYDKENAHNKAVHLRDHMVGRSAHGKKWMQEGIIARQVVTFRRASDTKAQSPAEYAAALEYGRDSFMQVVRKKPFGIKGGDTSFWLRKVGAAKAQPFLREAQSAKAQQAYNEFAGKLSHLWMNSLKAVARKRRSSTR